MNLAGAGLDGNGDSEMTLKEYKKLVHNLELCGIRIQNTLSLTKNHLEDGDNNRDWVLTEIKHRQVELKEKLDALRLVTVDEEK